MIFGSIGWQTVPGVLTAPFHPPVSSWLGLVLSDPHFGVATKAKAKITNNSRH
jgi:hypothetical protein